MVAFADESRASSIIIMADHEQMMNMAAVLELLVTHVLIDKSVDVIEIEENDFKGDERFTPNQHLVQLETHDGTRSVGTRSFFDCKS